MMKFPTGIPARPRLRPPPGGGWLMWLRLALAALPIAILLLDILVRKGGTATLADHVTAAALVLAAVALLAHHLARPSIVRLVSLPALVLAAIAMLRAGHFSAPLIDYWPQPGGFLWSVLPLFAMSVSAALLFASLSSRRHFWAMAHICLGIAVAALSLVGLLGEMYEMVRWFELDRATTRIVVMRGALGLALGASMAMSRTSLRLSLRALRRWAHVAATVGLLFLAVLMAELLRLEELRDLRGAVHSRAGQVIDQLESRFAISTHELRRMARSRAWEHAGSAADRDVEAWSYVESTPELQAVLRVDTSFEIEWAVPSTRYPGLKKGERLDNRLPEAARSLGRFSAEPLVSSALTIPDMGEVFIYLVPTLDHRMTDGFVVGFYRVTTLVQQALGNAASRFGVILQDGDGRVVHLAGRDDLPAAGAYLVAGDWELADSKWRVHVFPRRALLVDGFTVMPLMVLALGALLALTFGATLHQAGFARVSVRRLQREVQRRARLEAELRRHQHNLEQLVAQRTRELEERNRELKHVAGTDALTGVLNRGRFEEEFETLLKRARRYDRPLTLCLLDLDHFKWINDTHGHAAGDEVLRQVCRICRPILREHDIFARYGGEEFAFLMEETGLEAAMQVAERMRATLGATPIELPDGTRLEVTASFGLASFTAATKGRKQLFKQADEALYEAKANGRNRVEGAGLAA